MENITVTIPESYAGAVMGDVSGSRGRVTGMDTDEHGNTVVTATVPYAELVDYATRLRSITRGTGRFHHGARRLRAGAIRRAEAPR